MAHPSMEHRCGVRRGLELTVLVRRRGWAGSVVARLRDISISGAFIEGPPGAFPLYSLVQLEATAPGGASTRLMTCKALVARVGLNGVGLVFDQIRPRGLTALFTPAAATGSDAGTARGRPARLKIRPSESPGLP